MNRVSVVGAGLAGCEAAWQLAKRGIEVALFEMKPGKKTPAHRSDDFAELVCSNSFRGESLTNAVGLLKQELRMLGSLVVACADATRVGAGGALAVDREGFSKLVTERIRSEPLIKITEAEVACIPEGRVVIATGPLTSGALATGIAALCGGKDYLSFYDAAAPIVELESINLEKAFYASRYGRGADYINCPMTAAEYEAFRRELGGAGQAELHGFEDDKVFEGCMPVEVLARRGVDALRFGPLKPVGLTDPRTGHTPYAVAQLRRDNAAGSLYNMVGFQTHLRFPEQKRVFSMIPGLENAQFMRYGVMHRNTYLDSPRLLDRYYRLKSEPRVSFAGQMTGVEGYVESAASGFLAGVETARELSGKSPADFPGETAVGALALYVSDETVERFQPMNVNFGLLPQLGYRVKGKPQKNLAISERAITILNSFLEI